MLAVQKQNIATQFESILDFLGSFPKPYELKSEKVGNGFRTIRGELQIDETIKIESNGFVSAHSYPNEFNSPAILMIRDFLTAKNAFGFDNDLEKMSHYKLGGNPHFVEQYLEIFSHMKGELYQYMGRVIKNFIVDHLESNPTIFDAHKSEAALSFISRNNPESSDYNYLELQKITNLYLSLFGIKKSLYDSRGVYAWFRAHDTASHSPSLSDLLAKKNDLSLSSFKSELNDYYSHLTLCDFKLMPSLDNDTLPSVAIAAALGFKVLGATNRFSKRPTFASLYTTHDIQHYSWLVNIGKLNLAAEKQLERISNFIERLKNLPSYMQKCLLGEIFTTYHEGRIEESFIAWDINQKSIMPIDNAIAFFTPKEEELLGLGRFTNESDFYRNLNQYCKLREDHKEFEF